MFDTLFISTGRIPVGVPHEIKFKYLGNGDLIKTPEGLDSTKPSCKCTVPVYNHKNKILTVTYTPGAVPMHITNKKENVYKYDTSTIITFRENGSVKSYVLQIQAFPYDPNLKF